MPTDCLAAMLKEKLPAATRIDLALSFGTNPSIGTVNTMIESFGKGSLIREGGMLKVVSNAFQMRKIPFQNKPQWAMTIPWGMFSPPEYLPEFPMAQSIWLCRE